MEGRGVLYVATQNLRSLAEAALSAESVRRNAPGLPVAILTDRPAVAARRPDLFDAVGEIRPSGAYDSEWRRGIFDKCVHLASSPFEHTLYLDTDTRALSPGFVEGFRHLERAEMLLTACTPENSRSCRLYGRAMYNTGVVFYRRTERVRRLLARWVELSQQLFDLGRDAEDPVVDFLPAGLSAGRKRWLLQTDQLSLARLLSPDVNELGVAVETLPDGFNHRAYPGDSAPDGVLIAHCLEYKLAPDRAAGVLGLPPGEVF